MSLSIDWGTKVISVPQSYLTFLSGSTYEMDVNQFRLDLKDMEDSEEGIIFPDTHSHNTEVTVGGVTLAHVVEIINDYTVTFEDGQYAVNLYGANHNVVDVANLNQVSFRSSNSAGLITVVSGSGVTEQDKVDIADEVWTNTTGVDVSDKIEFMNQIQNNRWKIQSNQLIIYDDDGDTPLHVFNLFNKAGQPSETNVYERVPV